MLKFIKKEIQDYKLLLRNVPSLVVAIFILSVVAMNLLANKELFNTKYLALDCGFTLSWISFLCMDVICKRFGPKPAIKISILALFINLILTLIFKVLSLTPGMWGEYYSFGISEVNQALNTTIGGTWYVVLGSSVAMLVSSLVNSMLNFYIGKIFNKNKYSNFAARSFISTGIAQFTDNLIFAVMVSKIFFGWSWIQVILCSLTGAIMELLCEIIFSPIGYKMAIIWEKENVGKDYLANCKNG